MDKLKQLRSSGHPNVVKRFTPLSVTSAGELRVGTLRDDDYHVIDIVAMAPDIVIRPWGSTGNEFVPSSIHQGALTTCMNRPVVLDHPIDNEGAPISANTPEVLESTQFGHVFEPYYDNTKGLVLPSWLNESMATLVGDEAEGVISDFKAGVSREISIGAYVYMEEVDGVAPNGTLYEFIWLDYDLDHLAILTKGDEGACSNEAGCGPEFSTSVDVAKLEIHKETSSMHKWKQAALKLQAQLARVLPVTFVGAILDGELSTDELHEKLRSALSKDEGSPWEWYGWFKGVYVSNQVVVYTVRDDESGDMVIWQRGYTLADGLLTLSDEKLEVEGFTPVIKGASGDGDNVVNTPANLEGDDTMKVTDEVKRLAGMVMACERCPSYIKDEEYLNTLSEEALESILVVHAEVTPEPEPLPATPPVDNTDVVEVSRKQWEATQAAIAEMTPASNAWNLDQKAKKDALIVSIEAANPTMSKAVYSKWDLTQLTAYHDDLGLDEIALPNYSLLNLDPATSNLRDRTVSGLTHLRKQASA